MRSLASTLLFAGWLAVSASAFDGEHWSDRTRWSFDAGIGTRLWDLSGHEPEQRDYLEQARVGSVIGLDISVFPLERIGLGIAHARYYAAASDDDIAYHDMLRGSARDEYLIHYIAPALFLRQPFLQGRGALIGQAGVGMLIYRDDSPRGPFPGVQEGVTAGVHLSGSVDFRVLPWLGFGVGARFVHGTLDEVDYNAAATSVPEISLSRVDVLAGLRIYP